MKTKPFRFIPYVGAAAAFSAGASIGACTRHADIRDEREESLVPPPTVEAGVIPVVDSGLETDAHPACADRPTGQCVGSNDYPCAFEDWIVAVAKSCQTSTGCKTNGWLEVKMASDGCVTEIRMDQPNDDIIECFVAEFGSVRCPCQEVETSYYFGVGNMGVCGTP
jgi:hypothetical protein